MTGLAQVRARLADQGYELVRAWPRSADHLLLHLRSAGSAGSPGSPGSASWVAGQWLRSDARAASIARATRAGVAGPATHLRGTGVLVQPGGADRRLMLPPLLADPGAVLVAHRPERRAVVRHTAPAAEGTLGEAAPSGWTKAVRASRVAALLASASWQPDGVRVPRVVAFDAAGGSVTTSELPGVPLHGLGPGRSDAWCEAGTAVAALHAAAPPAGARPHGVTEELAVCVRWVELAVAHGALTPREAPALLARVTAAASSLQREDGPRRAPGPLHRDLHDKQVLVGPDGAGLLDLDLVAVGDPALDVANLLVHLHLRDIQAGARDGTTDGARGRAAAARAGGFLDGYGDPEALGADRVRAWAQLAAVRVAAVYAFRAASGPDEGRAERDDVGGPALGGRLLERVDAGLPGLGCSGAAATAAGRR